MKKRDSWIILCPVIGLFITATLSNNEFLSPMYITKSIIVFLLLIAAVSGLWRKYRCK